MNQDLRINVHQELEILLHDYWHDVDNNWGRNAAEFYTEDAVFESPHSRYSGRENIRKFYQYRLDRGPRIAVHSVTNFRIELESPTVAISTWYLLLFAHDGEPILPSAAPIQIALMTDKCLQQPDGNWLYAHRKFGTLFEGGVPTTRPDFGAR